MKIQVLGVGDIVGKPGKQFLMERLQDIRHEHQIDFAVGNAENVSGGNGITPKEADQLYQAGFDVLTGGDHVWGKKEIIPYIHSKKEFLRPANLPEDCPGSGSVIVETVNGLKIGVIHVLGRTFMNPQVACPFKTCMDLTNKIREETNMVIIDFHCEATSEKVASSWYLDGKASLIFGTHTHVQTADERVMPKGTAYITDVGMTGPYESVLGRRVDRVLHRFLTQMPAYFDVATGDVRIYGVVATIDTETGHADSVKRICVTEDDR